MFEVTFSDSDAQTLENVARGKLHRKVTANFTNFHFALLEGGCSEKSELELYRLI